MISSLAPPRDAEGTARHRRHIVWLALAIVTLAGVSGAVHAFVRARNRLTQVLYTARG
jgi:hypothetical protein